LAALLWHRKRVIVATAAVVIVIAAVYVLFAPQVLETSARVQVRVLDQLLPDTGVTASNALAEQPGIMRSTAVVALAIASPNVRDLPLLRGDNGTIGSVQSRLSVGPGEQPGEFELSLTSMMPGDAEKLLDSVVAAYVSLETAQRVQSSAALTSDVIEQQRKTAADLEAAKLRLNDVTERRAEIEPDPGSRRLDAQERSDASAALADAREKVDDAHGVYERAVRFFGGEARLEEAAMAVAPIPVTSSDNFDPDVLPGQILQLQREVGQPASRNSGADVKQLAELRAKYAAGVRDRYQSAIDLQNQAQARFDSLEKRTQAIDALDDESSAIQNEVDRLTSINAQLTDRLGNSEMASDSRVSISVLQPAQTDGTPVWPRPLPILGVAALIGLVLGGGLALGFDGLDTRLRDAGDAGASAEAPLLGRLPAAPSDLMSLAERGQCVLLKPSDPCSLAYRALRRDLEKALPSGSDKTVLITSPTESRGTSVLASNLAISTARSGKRVALVDAHHSLCAINEIYGIEDSVGLSDAVAGTVKVAAAVHVTGLEGLEVLPVGSTEADWSELLNRPEFFEVLTELTERFDRVIIDGGCARSDECRIISAFCDATVVLADARKCSRHDLRLAAEGLRAVGANITGIVLKGVGRGASGVESMIARPRRGVADSRSAANGNGSGSKGAGAAFVNVRPGTASNPAATEVDGLKIF
jgi:capsular exopolysaccharide synthesis family protein